MTKCQEVSAGTGALVELEVSVASAEWEALQGSAASEA